MNKKNLVMALLLSLFSLHAMATVVYVDSAHVGGTQNGTSWATAFSNFQSGINAANDGDSVWVAKGTYQPSASNVPFHMKEGVKIFGGFLNNHTAFSQRNWRNNPTILKGNNSRVFRNGDITEPTITPAAMLDGFTITKGRTFSNDFGGAGMFNNIASPTIQYCIFTDNKADNGAGAMENFYNANVELKYCLFTNNIGTTSGAIANYDSTRPRIDYCTFIDNKAWGAGAIRNENNTWPKINNCIFYRNNNTIGGAMITVVKSWVEMTNSIMVGNKGYAFAVPTLNDPAAAYVSNSIIWNNENAGDPNAYNATFITYSLAQDYAVTPANHNIAGTLDPLLVDTAAFNFRLYSNSPCINVGNNDSVPSGILTDIEGNNRIWGSTVDLGPYEFTFALNLGNDTTICEGNTITLAAANSGSDYLWSNGDTTQTIMVNTAGTYSVAVSNTLGTITDTIQVISVPYPTVNLGNDTAIAFGTSITLNAGNTGSSYLWNTGATTQSITVNTTNTYSVTVTNAGACAAMDTIKVFINPLGIDDVNKATNTFTIAPNPARDAVHINISDLKLLHTKAILTDVYGRVIREVMMNNASQELSLTGLTNGIYMLKMQNGQALKVVKE